MKRYCGMCDLWQWISAVISAKRITKPGSMELLTEYRSFVANYDIGMRLRTIDGSIFS
jgi:hypothetical protein